MTSPVVQAFAPTQADDPHVGKFFSPFVGFLAPPVSWSWLRPLAPLTYLLQIWQDHTMLSPPQPQSSLQMTSPAPVAGKWLWDPC